MAVVVAYHLDETVVPGGFLGVSLFFSISGFLIVGQLAAEHDRSGRIDLRRFWTRRLRRLAPAFSLTVFATVVVVAVREPRAVDRVVADAFAAIGYVANWRDMLAEVAYADRFARGAEPLAHLWSLSIEEQVYLVAPVVVGWWGVRRAGLLAGVAVAVGVLVWWGSADSYFATPVRLAEVVAGAALGVRVFRGGIVPPWLVRAAVPAAFAGLAAFAFVSDTDPRLFRLGLPLVSIVWVALLAGAVGGGTFARVLSVSPLRWIGDRSYAIYLFHVPIIELTDWSAIEVVAVTLLAAELSHRLVESPVLAGAEPVPVLVAGVVGVAVIAGLATAMPRSEPDVVVAVEAALGQAVSPAPVVEAPAVVSTASPSPAPPATVAAATEPSQLPHPIPRGLRVATVGDSTIAALEPAIEALLALRDGELVPRAVPGCSPLFTEEEEWSVRFDTEAGGRVEASHCRPSLAQLVADIGPVDAVVMFDHGMALLEHRRVGSDLWLSIADEELATALLRRYERWAEQAADEGAALVLATAPPSLPGSIAAAARGDDELARVMAYNDVVRRVAVGAPDVVYLLDFAAAVATDAERYEREDGVHFSESGGAVAVVVDHVGPALGEASSS